MNLQFFGMRKKGAEAMGEKMQSWRWARRRQIIWRVRWRRHVNIGANLPAREDRRWGRKALGKSRDLLRCLWN